MDHYQACRNSKGSTKKKKVHSVLNLAGSPTSHDICSLGAEAVRKSPEQCLASQSVSSAQSVTATGSEVVESGEGATKRKRNRKKKNKLHSINKSTPEVENIKDQSDSIADISASLIPAVQEAIRLLKASEEQMVGAQQSGSSNTTNQKSSEIGGKGEHSKTSAAEVVTVVSPGASRLAGLQSISSLAVNVSNHNAPLSGIESNVLNLKDLEFLKSASSLGPIYSRSPFSSSVTVTSSSLSNQLTSERICSSNLFSGTVRSSVSEISSPTDKMSAPQVSEKSRAEIEEERKKRKAAKAERKGKPKSNAQGESGTKPVVKEGPTKPSTSAQPSKSVDRKEIGHKDSVNTLDDSLRKMHLEEPIVSHRLGKVTDEPDFARSNFLPEAGVQSSELPKRFQHSELEIKEKGDKDKKDSSEKSKAELRAERRLKQETQRLAKAQQQQEKQKLQQDALKKPNEPQKKLPEKLKNRGKDQGKTPQVAKAERRVKLFSHLHQNSFKNISQTIGVSHPQYHMSIVRLGVQYSNRVILGSNARCLALLYTLKDLIEDYETPPQKEFSRGLEAYLQPNMDFLQQCRPHSVSMVNALRYIKWQLTQLSIEATDAEARQHILEAIDQYISDQIGKAAEAIGEVVKDKIDDNDVILVYACSSLVLSALKSALETKRKFHVIVVDSLPWLEGREMLRRLVSMGVQCSYVHLSAASFVMRQVSKVLLGAHALLANGYVMSRAGTAQVALLAHAYNVPVLVCCETYKFSERVQTDSIVYNELADPDELIGSRRAGERETERERPLANWRDIPSLSLLNLVYDVTPPELVTAVVTERAILPCTSVPVILRIKPTEC